MPFLLYLLIYHCCLNARRFSSVCSRVRYIDVGVIKQLCYKLCFFTRVSERNLFIIACTIFIHIILLFFYSDYYPYSLLGPESLSKMVIINDGKSNLCIVFRILEK